MNNLARNDKRIKQFLSISFFSMVISLAFGSACLAGGILVPHQDAAAMGMGDAFVAQADNPSAVWYNPAGITDLDGKRVSLGVVVISPVFRHENTNGTTDTAKHEVFVPIQLFATNKVSDKISIGLGINSPFGLADDWSVTSSTATVATFSRLISVNINPTVAYKISDSLSIAVGVDFLILQATMEKMLKAGAQLKIEGDGTGWGANAGIKYKANERINLGLGYRSRIKVKLDGKAEVNAPGLSNSAQADLTLADLIQGGISYKATNRLTLNFDLDYERWSTFKSLNIKSNTILALSQGATDTAVYEKDWKNTWTVHLGGEYSLSELWKLRAGYYYDQNAVPSDHFETSCPDADKHHVAIGAGYKTGNFTIDASYMYSWFNNRTIRNSMGGGSTPIPALDGTYKSDAHLFGLTVAYKF